MRFPRVRFRFRLRTLMILVAVVAVGIGGYFEFSRLTKLRADHREQAGHHARQAAIYRDQVANSENGVSNAKDGVTLSEKILAGAMTPQGREKMSARRDEFARLAAVWQSQVPVFSALARYHRDLSRKYAHAANRPWLRVAPDPTSPERPDEKSIRTRFADSLR